MPPPRRASKHKSLAPGISSLPRRRRRTARFPILSAGRRKESWRKRFRLTKGLIFPPSVFPHGERQISRRAMQSQLRSSSQGLFPFVGARDGQNFYRGEQTPGGVLGVCSPSSPFQLFRRVCSTQYYLDAFWFVLLGWKRFSLLIQSRSASIELPQRITQAFHAS